LKTDFSGANILMHNLFKCVVQIKKEKMLVECVFLDIKLIADVTRCIGLTHNAPHKQIRMFSIKFNVMGYGQGSIC